MNKILVFVINVDWYFRLHWIERAVFFQQQGFDIHIITNFTDNSIQDELILLGFNCHQLNLKRKSVSFFLELRSFIKLKKLLVSINPSLIHCVTVKPNIYTGLFNRLLIRKPIIYSITGLGATFSSSSIKFKFLKQLITKLYKLISTEYSRFIFENSEDYGLFLRNNIIKNKNGVVIKGAGIDLNLFLPSPPPCNKTVLFAARLLRNKGLYELVEAKKILSRRDINFTLKVAGILDTDVSSAIPIQQIESWSDSGDIVWLGNVSDMPNLIKTCDVVCLPTTYGEGVPRILIEAAACQRAIVATDVVGCREIVEHGVNGLLAAPSSPKSLAACLEELLFDKDKLEKFGQQGRKKVTEEFSQEMVFEKTLQIYKDLLVE